MKTDVRQVRTGKPSKVVGEVEVPVYETTDELLENEDVSRVLSMFNKQNAVRIMGNERAKHTLARVGKGKRFEIGYNLLWQTLTPEEANECVGNIEKLKEVMASDVMQKAIDDFLAEAGA